MEGRAESPLATRGSFTDSSTIIGAEFSAILSPIHQRLASDKISTSEAAVIFSSLFKAHLERYEVLPTPGTFHSTKVLHHTRRIERLVQNLRVEKLLTRSVKQIPGEFHGISRVYNKALKSLNHSASSKSVRRHEKAFKSNPWTYSRKLCSYCSSSASPTCTAEEIHLYFSNISKASNQYQLLPQWLNEV